MVAVYHRRGVFVRWVLVMHGHCSTIGWGNGDTNDKSLTWKSWTEAVTLPQRVGHLPMAANSKLLWNIGLRLQHNYFGDWGVVKATYVRSSGVLNCCSVRGCVKEALIIWASEYLCPNLDMYLPSSLDHPSIVLWAYCYVSSFTTIAVLRIALAFFWIIYQTRREKRFALKTRYKAQAVNHAATEFIYL